MVVTGKNRASEFGGDGRGMESYTTNDMSTRTAWAIQATDPADEQSGAEIITSKVQ